MKEDQQLSRKQLRKAKKQQKKHKAQKHQENISHFKTKKFIRQSNQSQQRHNNKLNGRKVNNKKNQKNKQQKQQQQSHKQEEQAIQQEQIQYEDVENAQGYIQEDQYEQFIGQNQYEDQDNYAEGDVEQEEMNSEDRQIALLEQKLNMGPKKGGKYEKMAKNMGFDDDLFSFLDNISKKVKKPISQSKNDKKKKITQQNIKKQQTKQTKKPKKINKAILKEQKIQQQLQPQYQQIHQENIQKQKNSQINQNFIQTDMNSAQLLTIKKSMNALLNKISDGNLTITLRQFINIFQNYSKSETHQVFSQLFLKFNLLIQKPLVHILTANVVIAVALTMIYGPRLMANILRKLTTSYLDLQKQQQNQEQIIEIGYSRVFQKKKNYIGLISYFYQFSVITAEFISSLINQLSQGEVDSAHFSQNAELIYIIIQKCGPKMRNNDTTTLKQVLDTLKIFIQKSKQNNLYETTKIKFIEIQMNQIRFNRKSLFDADQRMGFLHTFLTKIVPSQAPVIQNKEYMVILNYEQIINADITIPHWWENLNINQNNKNIDDEDEKYKTQYEPEEIKQLKELAKKYHFVTEIRRNIFVELMSSKDYLEATHRLIDLKVRKLEQIATVLVEVNLREPDSFNPFYVLVASKLCGQIPKLRVCLQFSIWDRIKQLKAYDARKISNLGKFFGRLLSSEVSNCSLSMLKFFTDLTNLKPDEQVFVKVVFKQLFRKIKMQSIAKLVLKLKQQKNKSIRSNIRQYLDQLQANIKEEEVNVNKQSENQKIKSHLKLMKKLIYLQEQQQMDIDLQN